MTAGIETIEHHHNALQIYFNLLLLTLSERQPEIVDGWLASLLHVLDSEPAIPEKQRELMQAQFVRFAEHIAELKKKRQTH